MNESENYDESDTVSESWEWQGITLFGLSKDEFTSTDSHMNWKQKNSVTVRKKWSK